MDEDQFYEDVKANLAQPKFSFLKDLKLDYAAENKLTLSLLSVIKGNDNVYMSPMAKEHKPDYLVKEWDKIFAFNNHRMNDDLKDLELKNKNKIGPRSIASPWADRRESLLRTFKAEGEINDKLFISRLGDWKDKTGGLRPTDYPTALRYIKNNTNSGLPYLTRKGLIKDRLRDKLSSLIKRKDPCVLFTRTQEGGKTRNVWGYPAIDVYDEMRYFIPFLEWMKKQQNYKALLGPDDVDLAVSRLIDRSGSKAGSNYTLLSGDFDEYDTRTRGTAQRCAFLRIRAQFQNIYQFYFANISDRFKNIGIVTPDGIMSGPHGTPTGSPWTNAVGSINHNNMIEASNVCLDWQVQGDDGVYLIDNARVDDLFKHFAKCGFEMNKSKCYQNDDFVVYLQNLHHRDYRSDGIIRGIYPCYRALNRIMYQERWSNFEDYEISGKDYYSIRAISILENCRYHPLFEDLVKFVLKYDKYSLDVSDQGLNKYVQMIFSTKGAGEVLKQQRGNDLSGIRNFATVKLIKELS